MTVRYISKQGLEQPEERSWPSPPDPGDLSKRIARRRAELRLSQAQLAARAGMSLRYVEYLERYPARPSVTALRQLAAALRTTPAALLGAGDVHAGHSRWSRTPVMTKLMSAECRQLIARGGVGRIAFRTVTGPVVLPVNFAVLAGTIVIRTAEGTAIEGHADELVALEVDHLDEALRQGWSVLVRGQAHRVTSPAELRRLQEDAVLWPWPGGDREVYVRILPTHVTGRRIESS